MSELPVKIEDIPKHLQFAASLTDHPIILDGSGIYRYQARPIILWLWQQIDLNMMWAVFSPYLNEPKVRDDLMQFYRDIGYSLHGFEEVFAEELDKMEEELKQEEEK